MNIVDFFENLEEELMDWIITGKIIAVCVILVIIIRGMYRDFIKQKKKNQEHLLWRKIQDWANEAAVDIEITKSQIKVWLQGHNTKMCTQEIISQIYTYVNGGCHLHTDCSKCILKNVCRRSYLI